jgi:hypothetical protein
LSEWRIDPPDYSRSDKREKKGRGNVVRWKIHTLLLLREDLKIAAEAHPLFVVMKEIRDFWRGGPMRTHKPLFLVLSW